MRSFLSVNAKQPIYLEVCLNLNCRLVSVPLSLCHSLQDIPVHWCTAGFYSTSRSPCSTCSTRCLDWLWRPSTLVRESNIRDTRGHHSSLIECLRWWGENTVEEAFIQYVLFNKCRDGSPTLALGNNFNELTLRELSTENQSPCCFVCNTVDTTTC